MSIWIVFAVYVLLSATGLMLIKTGTADMGFKTQGGILNFQISFKMIIGAVIYICSFLLSLYVMSKMNLSLYYPISAGAILIITCILGYYVLKEQLGTYQILGIILIVAGIITINIKK